MTEDRQVPQEQITYANLLFYGAWLGIFIMVVTYVIYAAGVLTPHVPVDELPRAWKMSVTEYVHAYDIPLGWGWVNHIGFGEGGHGDGDFLNFIGIGMLAGLTIVCYLTLIPVYARRREFVFFSIVVLEIIVLTVAASGVLGTGGH